MLKPAHRPSEHRTEPSGVALPGRGRRAGSGRILVLAAALFSSSPLAAAQDEPDSGILYQYQRPKAPGDAFALRFDVPPDHLPAVLITNRTADPEVTTDDETIDFGSTLVLPLPVDDAGGLTGLDGVLPAEVTPEQLANSVVEIRLVFLSIATGEFLLSDPLELMPEDSPVDDDEPDQDASDQDESALTAQDMAPSTADEAAEDDPETQTTSGENDNPPNPKSGSYAVGSNIINTPMGTMAVRSLTSAAMLSIYDQPTPVQGSGH